MSIPVIQPPSDGFTDLEKLFIRDLFVSVYREIEDPISRFIIMAHFECGYTQAEIGKIIAMSQPSVLYRIRRAQQMLRGKRRCNQL